MTNFPDMVTQYGGVPLGGHPVYPRTGVPGQRIVYFVDGNNGSDDSEGHTWHEARATIQSAVTSANSAKHALDNVDILVANGYYEETVQITRAGTELTETAMLWQNMGYNCGYIGTLRLIAGAGVHNAGHVKWTCGTTATTPPLYIGRPNVEIHGFNIQENSDETTTAGLWGDSDEMSGHAQISMPAILCEDEYNGETIGTLLHGAGNNVLIKNCRINSAGVLNSGAKWINVEDCILEYGEYGVAMIANSKGRASESTVRRCQFSQKTYDIIHGYAVTCWVDDCRFSSSPTTHIFPLAAHAASELCVVSNSHGFTEAVWNGTNNAKNAGWAMQNCSDTTAGGGVSNAAMNNSANNKP